MPTLDRLPHDQEVLAHTSAYPIIVPLASLRPEVLRLFGLQGLIGVHELRGGVWFLRDLHGVVRASVLSVQETNSVQKNPVLAWDYDPESGGYVPSVPPTDIVLAQSLDAVTGKTVE